MISNRTQRSVFVLVCMIAVTTFFGKAVHAESFPWEENSNSVSRVLMLEDGQNTGFGGIIDRIESRNHFPYYVVRDPYLVRSDRLHSKIVVMGGCPAELVPGDAIFVEGIVQALASGERCIGGQVTAYGFFNQHGRKLYWTPFFELLYSIYKRKLPVPTSPIPPSDPSLPDDGTGISETVTAYKNEGISKFDTVASFLAAAPPILTRIELACKAVVSVGEDYIFVGDNSADTASAVKVYTNDSSINQGDRIITLKGTVHREVGTGEIVVYAGGGIAPYLDIKGKDNGGAILAARSGVAAAKSTSFESANTQSSVMTITPSSNPPQIGGGSVDLSGKVVTAVFFQPGTQTISSFYIQEPVIGGNGIKVVPQQSCTVVIGDTVRVLGNVIASSPTITECYVAASTVERIGYRVIPGPAGTTQRSAASGVFGLQQALYSDTTVTHAIQGSGLSAIGARVKIWGKITHRNLSGTVCFVDDGSSLKSTYAGQIRTGIRVIWPQECVSTYQMNDYICVTGVMGAELSEDDPTLPVPVIRVHCGEQGRIIKVKWSSPGPVYDGKTWETAYQSIQQAINSAVSGDEVWVASGTYQETAAITMKSGVSLYGGFAGAEVAREERNWKDNTTIIDGGSHYSSDSVVVMNNISDCTIDGFTIQGGQGLDDMLGGGIYCDNATDCTIANNVIRNNTVSAGVGGGICAVTSSLTVVSNVLIFNSSVLGSGIYCGSTVGHIANNTIIRNLSNSNNGSVYLTYCPDPPDTLVLSNNVVAFNIGGGVYKDGSNPILRHNNVYGNTNGNYNWAPVKSPEFTDFIPAFDPDIPYVHFGDWHISKNSPCKDKGAGIPVSTLGYQDVDAESRMYYTGVDLGADEWNGTDPPLPPNPSIFYVKPGGTGTSGRSWIDAVGTVQAGIELANTAGGGEVWVAQGTYDESISLKPFVKVYGGFAVGDDEKSDRNWSTRATILQGDGSSSVVTISGITGCDIDGFIIQGGGQGIHINNAAGAISHNIIKYNGPWNGDGAGIYSNNSSALITNNFIFGNDASSSGGGLYLNLSDAAVLNNTIANNSADKAGGVYVYGSNTTVINNIVAFNSSGIYLGNTPRAPRYNNVWSNGPETTQYWRPDCLPDGLPDKHGNIIKDPGFVDIANDNLHIRWDSGCRDAGFNNVSLPDDFDIDKETKRNGLIDIGADEGVGACWRYHLTVTAESISAPKGTGVKVTAHVFDSILNQPAAGYRVNFAVDSPGVILSISPDQHLTSSTTGWGTTTVDSQGTVEAFITRNSVGYVNITATIAECNDQLQGKELVYFYDPSAPIKVGFLYDLALEGEVQPNIDQFLAQIDASNANISYQRITGQPFTIDGTFDVVFLATPIRSLDSNELAALSSFVQSGRRKRLVLVGEYSPVWNDYNIRLNKIAASFGMGSQFSESGTYYDGDWYSCTVNPNHYLTAGVYSLRHNATGVFRGCEDYAQPVAYTYQDPLLPMIIEEDTVRAGSRILVHDSNVLQINADPTHNNFEFGYNLCTVFPQ